MWKQWDMKFITPWSFNSFELLCNCWRRLLIPGDSETRQSIVVKAVNFAIHFARCSRTASSARRWPISIGRTIERGGCRSRRRARTRRVFEQAGKARPEEPGSASRVPGTVRLFRYFRPPVDHAVGGRRRSDCWASGRGAQLDLLQLGRGDGGRGAEKRSTRGSVAIAGQPEARRYRSAASRDRRPRGTEAARSGIGERVSLEGGG